MDTVFSNPAGAYRAALIMPRVEQTDDVTVTYHADDFVEAFEAFGTAMMFRDGDSSLHRMLMELEGAKKVQRKWVEGIIKLWYEEPPFPPVKYLRTVC